MADPNTRQGKRTPVTLKIKFKSETLEQFIERYAVDVSQGGIFIRTKEPLAVGTQMKFEFQLRDASPLIAGEGTVVWTRENDPSRPAIAPGMGVRFDKLAEGSQQVLEKILAEKAKQAPQRAHTEQTKPPMFADTPTRVAPAPVQDALLNKRDSRESMGKIPRPRSDSEQTPLPKPMPFHSDADEFPEEAFEEATKVRSLDELVAATAEADPKSPSKAAVLDELAARRTGGRADSTLADPPSPAGEPPEAKTTEIDRESAPGLPSPPSAGGDQPAGRKPLDTSPSPRQRRPSDEQKPESRPSRPSAPASESAAKTKLGVEPAKASTRDEKSASPVEATETRPIKTGPSAAPIIIGVLVLVAAGVAALWFFVLREPAAENAKQQQAGSADVLTPGSAGSAAMVATGSDMTGSAAMVATGSAGSATEMAGSAAVVTGVDTVISSSAAKATVDVDGQSGPAPFTAKLEKGKPFKAHVTAPGFLAKDIDVKGGEKASAKLDPKPRVLSVSSEPAGAEIYVDGVPTGQQTPADVKIAATKTKVRVTLRKASFRPHDAQVDVSTFTEDDAKLSGSVDGKLEKAPVVVNTGGGATHPAGGGTGSATPANGGSSTNTGTTGGSTTGSTGTGTAGTGTTGTGTGTTGTGTTGTGTTGTTGTGTGTTGTGTTGTGTTSTGTSGTTGTGTTGAGTTGGGTTGGGAGSAKSSEPEPDWSKQK